MTAACRLRHWTAQARAWVLGLFAFAVLTASAAPLVHPKALQLVCSAESGLVWVALDGVTTAGGTQQADPAAAHSHDHLLDCALCLPIVGPASGAPSTAPSATRPTLPIASWRQPARAEPAPGLQPPRGPPARV